MVEGMDKFAEVEEGMDIQEEEVGETDKLVGVVEETDKLEAEVAVEAKLAGAMVMVTAEGAILSSDKLVEVEEGTPEGVGVAVGVREATEATEVVLAARTQTDHSTSGEPKLPHSP